MSNPATREIYRLILLLTTADKKNADTENTITLKITDTFGQLVVDHTFTDTTQDDLERAQANFYYAEVKIGFLSSYVNSIQLSINGDDAWLPASLFLFGLDAREAETVKLVTPLVT